MGYICGIYSEHDVRHQNGHHKHKDLNTQWNPYLTGLTPS